MKNKKQKGISVLTHKVNKLDEKNSKSISYLYNFVAYHIIKGHDIHVYIQIFLLKDAIQNCSMAMDLCNNIVWAHKLIHHLLPWLVSTLTIYSSSQFEACQRTNTFKLHFFVTTHYFNIYLYNLEVIWH